MAPATCSRRQRFAAHSTARSRIKFPTNGRIMGTRTAAVRRTRDNNRRSSDRLKGSIADVSEGRDQRIWPHRPQRAARDRRERPHGHRSRRHQRSRPGGNQRASVALRQRARPLPRRGQVNGRHDRRRHAAPSRSQRSRIRPSCRTRSSASTSRSNAPASSPRATRPLPISPPAPSASSSRPLLTARI